MHENSGRTGGKSPDGVQKGHIFSIPAPGNTGMPAKCGGDASLHRQDVASFCIGDIEGFNSGIRGCGHGSIVIGEIHIIDQQIRNIDRFCR